MDGVKTSGWGRLPCGVLGMIGLMVAVESAVVRHSLDLGDLSRAGSSFAARASKHQAPGNDVLYLGDSLMKMGLDARIVASRTGRKGFNLAIMGGQAPASYFLLRRALRAGARPAAVVVDFKANCLGVSPRYSEYVWPHWLTWREAVELVGTARDGSLAGVVLLGKALPSLRSRHEIRALVLSTLRGESPRRRDALHDHWRLWAEGRGVWLNGKNPSRPDDPGLVEKNVYYPEYWTCDPTCASYLRRLLRLAQDHDLPVFWLIPPINPKVQAKRERLGLDGLYVAHARAMQKMFPNVTIIDGRHARYAPSLFTDASHLDRDGAAELSAGVATVLQQHFARGPRSRPRWVELPLAQQPYDWPHEQESREEVASSARDRTPG